MADQIQGLVKDNWDAFSKAISELSGDQKAELRGQFNNAFRGDDQDLVIGEILFGTKEAFEKRTGDLKEKERVEFFLGMYYTGVLVKTGILNSK